MSTPPAAEPEQAGPELLIEQHWTAKDSPVVRACVAAVAEHGPAFRSVAHYSHGVLDFAVRPRGSAPLRTPRTVSGRLLAAEGWPGRHLVVCVEDFDRALQRLETGELMRLVVEAPDGGMYCARIRAGQHLVGVTQSGDTVAELDDGLNLLVTRIRREVHHLPDELLGGDGKLVPAEPAGTGELHWEAALSAGGPGSPASLRSVWDDHVNAVNLQYAAYYRDWTAVCAGDAFDDPDLGVRLGSIPSGERRAMYRDLAGRLRADITRLRQILRPVSDQQIRRLVLDVQEGAVYIHWFGHGPGTFLLGVTVDQPQVALAEERLGSLLTAVSGRS
ncbi:hypothetical protein [Actinacidiphila yeochonensis]|uniref:hypothetical protein n=1 Tax=Actinacidiphila yeochonensis TaxID=89050 RepID=UPI0007C687DE|nr:hypothetical protein [Actinacidiphila yeochonensis]